MATVTVRNGMIVTDIISEGDSTTSVSTCITCNATLETAELHDLGEFYQEHNGH